MLLKGMDREQAQLFLQQSIAQMCKVTVSFTGPIEIDGIICITGRDKDDLVLVKLHEKLTSPTVSDVDTLGSNNQDGECSLTPDLGTEPMNTAEEIEECLKRESSSFERDDDVGDSSLQPREDCTNAQDSGTAEMSNTCSVAFDISNIKVEPVMLDSESEDGVNVENTENFDICEPGESMSHIKRQFFSDLDTTDSYSKITRIADIDDSTALPSFPQYVVSQIANATGTGRSASSKMDRGQSQLDATSSGSLYCTRCREVFSEFDALREHTKCMHQMYICDQCRQLFTHISSLHRHMQLHGDTVNWLCTICQHKFKRKEHLSHHIACHFDMQLHQCGQCKKGFKVRSRLQVHMERQHRSKPKHMCKPCFMEFTETANFTEHQRRHREFAVTYKCDQCGFLGADRLALINHSIIHFGLRIDTSEQQQHQLSMSHGSVSV